MEVPQHITVASEPNSHDYGNLSRDMGDYPSIAYRMHVPERILIAGGDEIRGVRAPPAEVMLDRMSMNAYPTAELATPPGAITLDKASYPEITEIPKPVKQQRSEGQHESNMNQTVGSIAVEENPLRELKMMRRQLGRLSTRLYLMEDELERRKTKDIFLWSYLLGLSGIFLFIFFKKRY